jgi:hypothetical protein
MGCCYDDLFGRLYEIPNSILPCSMERTSSSALCVEFRDERKSPTVLRYGNGNTEERKV